jgi:hypothetical protein
MESQEDHSIRADDGRLVYICVDRFKSQICQSKCCFVCGESSAVPMTQEHVIPDWILKYFNLHREEITLPNKTLYRYDKYKVPMCEPCNKLLGRELEAPISHAFQNGMEGISSFLEKPQGKQKLFSWLCLIFIKTHYKDLSLLLERDKRLGKSSIAEEYEYDWGDMHHIYCVARSSFSRAVVDPDALGSLVLVPILTENSSQLFDLVDFTAARTIGIRIGDVGVIAVFGDCGAVLDQMYPRILRKINGSLSFPQFRELVAHFACCSLHHKNPPRFSSIPFEIGNYSVYIACTKRDSRPEFEEFNPAVLGKLMDNLLHNSFNNITSAPDSRRKLQAGELTFLFDENGDFFNYGDKISAALNEIDHLSGKPPMY